MDLLSIKSLSENWQIWFCFVVDVAHLDHADIIQFNGVARSQYLNFFGLRYTL